MLTRAISGPPEPAPRGASTGGLRPRLSTPSRCVRLLAAGLALLWTVGPACAQTLPTIYVTNSQDDGPGSLRQAILDANSAGGGIRIDIDLVDHASIEIKNALPPVAGAGIEIDGRGVTLVSGKECERPDGRRGCDGLVVTGPSITVRRLKATGFLFDGIAVRGALATGVRIHECECFGNLDDGIGVSDSAANVTIENCVLVRNGFRTKGKGLLIFDSAQVLARNNFIEGNRDGVTVSRRARAVLENNFIINNKDKGLGVSGATVEGRGNRIVGNGVGSAGDGAPPNGDGLRVSLSSSVKLEETAINGNGDRGVIVLDDARVLLTGGTILSNGRVGAVVRDRGYMELRGVTVTDNAQGNFIVEGESARLVR